MGATVAKLMAFGIRREIKIVMLGFKGAGKSTMLEKFNLGTVETKGTVESVQYKKLSIKALNLPPADKNEKDLLKRYCQKANGIIFVVDSVNREKVSEAKMELRKMIDEDPIFPSKVTLLVCANKQDRLDAINISDITNELDLKNLSCPWYVQSTCATTGQGLYEGLGWLINSISTYKS